MEWLLNGLVTLVATAAGGALALVGVRFQAKSDREAREAEAARQLERERRAALRRLIPALVEAAYSVGGRDDDLIEASKRMLSVITELHLWLRADEWPIARMGERVYEVAFRHDPDRVVATVLLAQRLMTAWFQGEASLEDVIDTWEADTGTPLQPLISKREAAPPSA